MNGYALFSPTALHEEMHRAGAVLGVRGDRLTLDAPASVLTADVIEALKAHKAALIRLVCRERVKALLLPLYRADPAWAVALRDLWAERIAILEADPACAPMAEAIALAEIEAALTTKKVPIRT